MRWVPWVATFCAGCTTGPAGTYCAFDIGLVNAPDVPMVGPVEQCAPAYPTCTPPIDGVTGWQCCADTTLPDGGTQALCMPNDAAAYEVLPPGEDGANE